MICLNYRTSNKHVCHKEKLNVHDLVGTVFLPYMGLLPVIIHEVVMLLHHLGQFGELITGGPLSSLTGLTPSCSHCLFLSGIRLAEVYSQSIFWVILSQGTTAFGRAAG